MTTTRIREGIKTIKTKCHIMVKTKVSTKVILWIMVKVTKVIRKAIIKFKDILTTNMIHNSILYNVLKITRRVNNFKDHIMKKIEMMLSMPITRTKMEVNILERIINFNAKRNMEVKIKILNFSLLNH